MEKPDTQTIIIRTSLRRPEGTRKEKETQKFQTEKAKKTKEGTENQIIQNGLEYADDTQLLMQKTHMSRCAKE